VSIGEDSREKFSPRINANIMLMNNLKRNEFKIMNNKNRIKYLLLNPFSIIGIVILILFIIYIFPKLTKKIIVEGVIVLDIRSINAGLEMYRIDKGNGKYINGTGDIRKALKFLEPKYISKLPENPFNKKNNKYIYSYFGTEEFYIIKATQPKKNTLYFSQDNKFYEVKENKFK